jgi:hypothetical protein
VLSIGIERILPAPGGNAHRLATCRTAALPPGIKRLGCSGEQLCGGGLIGAHRWRAKLGGNRPLIYGIAGVK